MSSVVIAVYLFKHIKMIIQPYQDLVIHFVICKLLQFFDIEQTFVQKFPLFARIILFQLLVIDEFPLLLTLQEVLGIGR